jgi:hypothetical protein
VSAAPDLGLWLHALVVLALGGAVVVAPAALLGRAARTAAGRRLAWQAAVLGLGGLLLSELTGLAAGAGDWLSRPAVGEERPGSVGQASSLPGGEAGWKPAPRTEPAAAGTDRAEAPPGPDVDPAVWWPGLVWLAGAALVAGRAALAHLLLLVFRRRHRPPADETLRQRVRSVAERLGLRRRVLVLEADGLRGPVAFGVFRRAVALPASFAASFTPAQQEAMLAHELAHLAARDPAWHLLTDLVTAALWWHPLAWWARQQLRAASELAADEASLVVADGPGVLAGCLVELGARLAATPPGGWLRMAGSGFRSSLGRRVERLLRLPGRTWRRPGWARTLPAVTLGPAALLAAAILATAWAQARALPEGDEPMRTPWKRSLAALVLVAALGSDTKPALSGDPQPPAGGAQPAPADRAAGVDDKTQQLEKTQQDVQKALDYLARQKADLERQQGALQRGAADDKALDKLNDELEKLQQQAGALEQRRAELEAQIKALRDKQEAAAGPRIKIFRLKYRDALEVANVLKRFLALQAAVPAGAMGMGPMGPGGMPGMGGGMTPGGKGGGMMGGPGGMMGGGTPGRTWSVAADQRANCVIVRGTEHDLQVAADLVATLDVAEGKPAPQSRNLRVIRLRFADANEVAQVLEQLHVEANVVPAPKAHAVIVSGPPAALKEVGEVIEALDVEGKPDASKEQPRGGTRPPGPGGNNPGGGN